MERKHGVKSGFLNQIHCKKFVYSFPKKIQSFKKKLKFRRTFQDT